ncbi:twitching motility protein PilT [Streptomyces abyssalis]|uniref:Ribonuclease VapC n=1 Tax=Streptomyces abyssalis TaxID=933944 RepID=A0A1E7JI26_9ACTN|nr:PIN domain-containing protein [Streptomyces abyssalis]OEU86126.1 twitching motility protein PilT [Streptomyces abyssalis]OEU92407.1 twitching motility protein PilT [Streptomyces abyssalis]OEV30122.1 twitching motility protein PilT [Streptomyces nanshensis]
MARRLILDTGVLIRAERDRTGLAGLLERDDDVTISAMTLTELQLGVELSEGDRRIRRQEYVDGVHALVPVEDYTSDVARVHARLLAHVRRTGKPRNAHDLIIAATAAATARTLVTLDGKAAFEDLPGVNVIIGS